MGTEDKCPDCGGDVVYYHEPGGVTRIVCKQKCHGWKIIRRIVISPMRTMTPIGNGKS
jgi:hypothetical protein